MGFWKKKGWEQFWEIEYGEKAEAILLSTYGFDPKLLWEQLLPRVLGVGEEPGGLEWHMSMKEKVNEVPTIVFCDAKEYAKKFTESYTIFERCGGHICKVFPTQHAKLWMIKTNSRIRIAIGSCNLTTDAFQNQIQYIWMDELSVNEKTIGSHETAYLSNFMANLFTSARNADVNGKKEIKDVELKWRKWINRCAWPEGIKLIGSIPEKTQKSNNPNNSNFLYGLPAMKSYQEAYAIPPKRRSHLYLYVQVFSTFTYNDSLNGGWLDEFREAFGCGSLVFLWPEKQITDENQQWKKMQLSCSLLNKLHSLNETGSLRYRKNLIENLNRLPHGKLYMHYNQRKESFTWSMIGSSNFSPSAWGSETKPPANFELNVIIDHNKIDEDQIFKDENQLGLHDFYCNENIDDREMERERLCLLDACAVDEMIVIHLFVDKKLYVNSVNFYLMNKDGSNIASEKKTTEWQKQKFSDQENGSLVKADIHFKNGTVVSISSGIQRNNDMDQLIENIFPQYDENWKMNWILQKYGWKEAMNVGGYQVPWMMAGMNTLNVVDRWSERYTAAKNEWQQKALKRDAESLMRAFKSKKEKFQSEGSNEKLGWEMAMEELTRLL